MSERIGTTVQSVDRALYIVELLKENPDGLGVTDISYRLDVAKSTVHRLLSSLRKKGYVRQDEMTERYRLGLKLLELGEAVSENLDIRNLSAPVLNDLAKETGETVHLGVREGSEIVYVDKVERFAPIRMYSSIGKRSPLYCTGIGKVLLANLEKREEMVNSLDLHRFTDYTITDKGTLEKELATIEKQGFGFDEEEHELGIRCVAAPLYNHRREVVAAVSVAGSKSRMTDEKIMQCKVALLEAAQNISKRLGYS